MSDTLTLRDFMEVTNYRITESDSYGWSCYGPKAHNMSSWDGNHDGASVNCVFDTATQTVYEMSVCDYRHNRAYRWINPRYYKAYKNEATQRESDANQAWDDVDFVDLEVVDDILEKTDAIVNYKTYDTRIQVPIDLSDEDMLRLAMLAHERDITLNSMVEELLLDEIRRFENGQRKS